MELIQSGTYLHVGSKLINLKKVLFVDCDDRYVYVILSGRRTGYLEDDNLIRINFLDVTSPQVFTSAVELRDWISVIIGPGLIKFSSGYKFTVPENQTAVGTVVSEVDAVYSIESGYDGALFNINSSTGVISFKSAPSYETQNHYYILVKATKSGRFGYIVIEVFLTDVLSTFALTFSKALNLTTNIS